MENEFLASFFSAEWGWRTENMLVRDIGFNRNNCHLQILYLRSCETDPGLYVCFL